jgi:hypothetical protein
VAKREQQPKRLYWSPLACPDLPTVTVGDAGDSCLGHVGERPTRTNAGQDLAAMVTRLTGG